MELICSRKRVALYYKRVVHNMCYRVLNEGPLKPYILDLIMEEKSRLVQRSKKVSLS